MLGGPRWAITLQIGLSLTGLNIAGPTNLFVGANVHTSTGDMVVGNTTPKVGVEVDKLDERPAAKQTNPKPEAPLKAKRATATSVEPRAAAGRRALLEARARG